MKISGHWNFPKTNIIKLNPSWGMMTVRNCKDKQCQISHGDYLHWHWFYNILLNTNSHFTAYCIVYWLVDTLLKQDQESNREDGEVSLHFQQHDKKPMIPVSTGWAMSLSLCCSTLTNSSVLRFPSSFASNKWKTISTTLSERDKPQTWNLNNQAP